LPLSFDIPGVTMTRFLLVLLPLAGVMAFLFLVFMIVPDAMSHSNNPAEHLAAASQLQTAVRTVAQVTGLLLALLGGISLAYPAVEGKQAMNVLTCALTLAGGVLIMEPQWSVALAFGLIGVSVVLLAVFDRRLISAEPGRPVVDVVDPTNPGL
jgi:hypothetical protein